MLDGLAAAAHAEPDKPAIVSGKTVLSFRDLWRAIMARAADLDAANAPAAEPVHGATCPQCVVDFCAVVASGRAAAVMDPRLPERMRTACHARLAGLGPAVTDDPAARPFYIGFTSGSTSATGLPKGYVRSHHSWIASFAAADAAFGAHPPGDVGICGALSHSLFLFGAIYGLVRGQTLRLYPKFRPERLAEHLENQSVGTLYAVPAMLAALLHASPRFGPKRLYVSGAKLSSEHSAALLAAWPDTETIEFYGASELSFVSWRRTADGAPDQSVGRPFAGVTVAIHDDEASSGIVHVKSPMLFSGYWPEAGALPADPGPRFLTVGDCGFLDATGALHITGRADRVINSAGRKLAPEALEAVLGAYPGVALACVIGVPCAVRGAEILAIVEPAPGAARPTRGELARHCAVRAPDLPQPHRFFATHALPRTTSGKIAPAETRARVLAGDAAFEALP